MTWGDCPDALRVEQFRPAWHADAACRGRGTAVFFPGRGQNTACANAKAVCAGCPVRDECLDAALTHGELAGIWGGTSERERRRLRRQPARSR
jgi:WhiB family transcriptional regulator, redox-sensing transcriptional regulator